MSYDSDAHDSRCVRLSAVETTDLAGQIASLAEVGLPLASGLRAASEELRGSSLARVFNRLAGDLEAGQPLEQAIAAQGRSFPPHLRHLMLGTTQSDRLARLLTEVVRMERQSRDLRQRLWTKLAYPTFLLVLACVLMGFMVQWVIPQVARDMPSVSNLTGFLSFPQVATTGVSPSVAGRFLFWLVAILLSAIAVLWTASRLGATRVWVQLIQAVPLLGPLVRWRRMVRFTRLMEVLLQEQTPLPEALRVTAASVADADLAAGCRQAASQVEAGIPLAQCLAELPQFPPTLLSFVEWGQSQRSLAEAFHAAAEAFRERLDAQIDLVEGILPSTMILLVAGVFLAMFGTLLGNVFGALSFFSGMGGSSRSSFGIGLIGVNDPLKLLAGAGPLLFGLAVLAALRILSDPHRPAVRDATQQALYVIGWVLVTVGAMVCLTMLFGGVVALVGIVVAIKLIFRRRRVQQRALVALLAASAERLMPLVPAIEAFSLEYRGSMGERARRLANRLRAGQPLPLALAECRGLLPPGALPVIRAGYETGALAEALRQVLNATEVQEPMLRELRSRLFYVFCVLTLMGFTFSFLLLKILPAMEKIFKDFGTPLPPVTRWVFGLSGFSFLALPLGVLCLLVGLVSALPYFRISTWGVPVLGRVARRLDRAALLEALSFVAGRQRPLPDALRSLAETVSSGTLRRRLGRVAAEVEAGFPFTESLQRHGLLAEAECATLAAAARVGNLPWALRELAEGNRRRWVYRSQLLLSSLYPLVILALGSVVGLYVVGYFAPLVALIQGLVP